MISVLVLTCGGAAYSGAPFPIEYRAPANPTTEGFGAVAIVASAPKVSEPTANDAGMLNGPSPV